MISRNEANQQKFLKLGVPDRVSSQETGSDSAGKTKLYRRQKNGRKGKGDQ